MMAVVEYNSTQNCFTVDLRDPIEKVTFLNTFNMNLRSSNMQAEPGTSPLSVNVVFASELDNAEVKQSITKLLEELNL